MAMNVGRRACACTRSPTATSAPSDAEQAAMLAALGYASLDALIDAAVPASIREHAPLALGGGAVGDGGARRSSAQLGDAQRGVHVADRPRLLRHDHAAGDPAQRAREPGLVHGVHAVPARDLAGPARGAAELPDDGRPTSPGWRSRTRRCSTKAPRPPRRWRCAPAERASAGDVFFVDADCHPQTIEVVRTRAEPLGIDGGRRRSARRARRADGCFGVLLQYPGSSGRVRDHSRA